MNECWVDCGRPLADELDETTHGDRGFEDVDRYGVKTLRCTPCNLTEAFKRGE